MIHEEKTIVCTIITLIDDLNIYKKHQIKINSLINKIRENSFSLLFVIIANFTVYYIVERNVGSVSLRLLPNYGTFHLLKKL